MKNKTKPVQGLKTPVAKAVAASAEKDDEKEKESIPALSTSVGTTAKPEVEKIVLHGVNATSIPNETSESEEYTEFIISHCPTGKSCEEQKCKGKGDVRTCCECGSWNSEGKCLPGEWKVLSGAGMISLCWKFLEITVFIKVLVLLFL